MRRLLTWLRNPEVIGAPDCPLILRWTIFEAVPADAAGDADFFRHKTRALFYPPLWLCRDRKLMIHHFLPEVEDRDPHDHPRGFWTFVVRGSYFDLVPCYACEGHGFEEAARSTSEGVAPFRCSFCDGIGTVIGEVMRPGKLRFRPAKHTHITQSGPDGAWTVVLMQPFERAWGFWRKGRFWTFKDYERAFGFAHRCPTDAERESVDATLLKYTDEGAVMRKKKP